MSKPVSTTDNNDNALSDRLITTNSDIDYAALTDALEHTVFENFDNGLYIGMMSGTSLDGMDAVLCQFSTNHTAPMQLLATYSQDFPPRLREVLLALCLSLIHI